MSGPFCVSGGRVSSGGSKLISEGSKVTELEELRLVEPGKELFCVDWPPKEALAGLTCCGNGLFELGPGAILGYSVCGNIDEEG